MLTVTTAPHGEIDTHALFIGSGRACFEQAVTPVSYTHLVAYEAHCRTFELAFKANLKIGVGTDFFPGPDNALEMEFLAGLGMDPMAVIQAATKTGAEVLMRNDIGTLDKGKLADIILVSGNPLKNMGLLRRTENVKVVMQGGKIVKQL